MGLEELRIIHPGPAHAPTPLSGRVANEKPDLREEDRSTFRAPEPHTPDITPYTAPPAPRSGIVLLMTLFFIMAITVVVGVSLSRLQQGSDTLRETRLLAQSAIAVEDVRRMVQLLDVNSSEGLNLLLQSASLIPVETPQYHGLIKIASARGHLNVNTLKSSKIFQESLIAYLQGYNVNDPYYLVNLMIDCMSGTQPAYTTDIFERIPWLYRERIADREQFDTILDHYVLSRRDGAVYNVPWQELFRFGDVNDTALDANYVSPELWAMMLPDAPARPEAYPLDIDLYTSGADLQIEAADVKTLEEGFTIGYYTPMITVDLTLGDDSGQAKIGFEYDLQKKKAGDFSYVL